MGLRATATAVRRQLDEHDRAAGIAEGSWEVQTIWSSEHVALDRPAGIGFTFGPNHRELAIRLATAITAGVVFTAPEIKRDVNGRTYVSARSQVLGRRANADLKRLGF